MTKLAFGCGHLNHHDKGYKNVDIRKDFAHIDFPGVDISKKLPWEDNSIEEILAESVLEHIPHGYMLSGIVNAPACSHLNTVAVLTEWCRVLKKGGKIVVKVPNIKGIVTQYLRNNITPRDFWLYLYGGQEYKENTHYCGFDPKTLEWCLRLAGFEKIALRNCHKLEEPLNEDEAWEMSAVAYKK